MAELIAKGTWVEIKRIVLTAEGRAPQVPEDTKKVPLEMRVKGFLFAPAAVGQEVEILTPSGRRLSGILVEINPSYSHSFGSPVPELSVIGAEIRSLLREKEGAK